MELISALYVLPIDKDPINEGAIAVEFGKIHAVGRLEDLKKQYPEAHTREYPKGVLMPGLVNAHTHLDVSVGELYEPSTSSSKPDFVEWLVASLKRRQTLNSTALIAGIQSCVSTMINAGNTTIGDMTSFEGTFKIIEEMGMRAIVYAEIFGGSGGTTAQDRFETALALVEKYNDEANNRLRVGLGPLAPYLISRHVLKIASQHAQHMGIPIQIHAAESFAEMEFFYDSKGPIADILFPALGWGEQLPPPHHKTPIQYLHEIGFLDACPSIVGGLHLGIRDFSVLAKTSCKIVHCPKTNHLMGNGTFPFEKLKNNDICVGIGTDSLNGPHTATMWDELRFITDSQPAGAPSAKELLRMATFGSACCLNIDHLVGTLTPGKQADYIVIDVPPCPDPIFLHDSVIRNTRPANVRVVAIAGDILKNL